MKQLLEITGGPVGFVAACIVVGLCCLQWFAKVIFITLLWPLARWYCISEGYKYSDIVKLPRWKVDFENQSFEFHF